MKPNGHIFQRINGERFVAAGMSDTGLIRAENQDSIYLDEAGHFLLLADGMGGHERGEIASFTLLEILSESLKPENLISEIPGITKIEGVPDKVIGFLSLVNKGINKANSVLYGLNEKEGLERYMGSTIAGLVWVEDDNIIWFHVGDSRVYRWRDTQLKCLTVDHSAFSDWVRNGRVGREPGRNIVTRAVGPREVVTPDINYGKCRKGDIYLLCSDGLNNMLTNEQIADILDSHIDVEDIVKRLIDSAINAGGIDNVSAIVSRF